MPLDLRSKKILVTGGSGFLGSHLVQKLLDKGVPKENIFVPNAKQFDLRESENCKKVVQGRDIVIHLAAKVGGIGFHREKPGEIFYDNLLMGIQLMEAARQAGVEKLTAIGTVCSYPKVTPVPFEEEKLWDGYPDEVTGFYGLAKKMLIVQSDAYRKQYGFNSIVLMPTNIYGPGDNFDSATSHVLAALIRRFCEAKSANSKEVVVWGTGNATREFVYVEDATEGIILATERYNKSKPVNLGTGIETPIRELAGLISRLVGYEGQIRWDISKPDGQPRRELDVSRAEKEFGFKAKVSLEEGVKKTINWFRDYFKVN